MRPDHSLQTVEESAAAEPLTPSRSPMSKERPFLAASETPATPATTISDNEIVRAHVDRSLHAASAADHAPGHALDGDSALTWRLVGIMALVSLMTFVILLAGYRILF